MQVDEDRLDYARVQLADPRLASGMALIIGQLMNEYGLTEIKLDPDNMTLNPEARLQFERQGDVLTIRRLAPEGGLN